METVESKNQLKLLDVHLIGKDMFSKQWLFEDKDKPGKHLARLLAEVPGGNYLGKMNKIDSTFTNDLK